MREGKKARIAEVFAFHGWVESKDLIFLEELCS